MRGREVRLERRYHGRLTDAEGPMKPSLTVKVWILIGYVLVCTAFLLLDPPDTPPSRQSTISAPGGADDGP